MLEPTSGSSSDTTDSLQLAHLSDPHLTSLNGISWNELANKRFFGYLSWLAVRKHQHKTSILKALLNDLKTLRPDHIAITGDLTHIGTGNEFREVSHWLSELGPPEKVTIIPGNHDHYVHTDWREKLFHWLPYLGDGIEKDHVYRFPLLRCRGKIAMIGVSSAAPTMPFLATGRIGKAQLQRLDSLLADLGDRKMFRIILLHHGPIPGSDSYRRRLVDGSELISILMHRGAELVLHGHRHKNMEAVIKTKMGDIPVFGVASASIESGKDHRTATYNLFRIRRSDGGVTIRQSSRSYNYHTGMFITGVSKTISYPHIS